MVGKLVRRRERTEDLVRPGPCGGWGSQRSRCV